MKSFFEIWLRLLSFRAGGADMPYAPRLLMLLMAITFALDAALAQVIAIDAESSPLWIAVRLAISLLLLYLLLKGQRKAERFVQTAIALNAAALAFSLLSMPLVLMLWPLPTPEQAQTVSAMDAMLAVVLFPMMLWFLILRAWLIHQATEYRYLLSFLISIALLIAEAALTKTLMMALK